MHKRVTCSPEERAAAKGAVSAMTEWQVAIVWSPEGGANARSLATSALLRCVPVRRDWVRRHWPAPAPTSEEEEERSEPQRGSP
jgi:hypothetical protein